MRVLDLFSGAGGAAYGLHLAWPDAEITGVDIRNQPRYPFTFVQGDAMTYDLSGYDFIWASPPCQSYSKALRHLAAPQPMLIDAVRERLQATSATWVIENVEGAPLPDQATLFGRYGAMVCGTAVGLRVYRHRLFESNRSLRSSGCRHAEPAMNPHRVEGRERIYREFGRQDPELIWRREMGVDWMNRHETREAIPPAYSRYIAEQLTTALEQAA